MQNQIMADLPLARFQINEPPFCNTRLDLFGSLTVKVKRSNVKRYGCLFTCMTTRAYFHNKAKISKKKSSIGLLLSAKILQEAMRLSYPYLYKINQKIEHQNARSHSCFGLKLSVKGGLNNLIFNCLSYVKNLVTSNSSEHVQNVIPWH